VLLCGHHHHVVHRGEWAVVMAADGRPDFHPPPGSTRPADHGATPDTDHPAPGDRETQHTTLSLRTEPILACQGLLR
jgi:hypothetical protein